MKHYVYQHVLDGEIIYVGCGNSERPHNFQNRTKKWNEVTGGFHPEVRIVKEFDDRYKARSYEAKMIRDIKPIANQWIPAVQNIDLMTSLGLVREGIKRMLSLDERSEVWLAKRVGMKPPQLNKFMRGQMGIGWRNLDTLLFALETDINAVTTIGALSVKERGK